MRSRSWWALATVALLTACGGPPAPRGVLPLPKATPREPYGGWVLVQYQRSGLRATGRGELIAITSDSMWVLPDTGGVTLALLEVRTAELWGYNPKAGAVGGEAFLGTLSTIANGVALIFTAPMWIIGGSVAAASQSRISRVAFSKGWQALRPYARFPQGMPPGVTLGELTRKPSP